VFLGARKKGKKRGNVLCTEYTYIPEKKAEPHAPLQGGGGGGRELFAEEKKEGESLGPDIRGRYS